MNLAGSAIWAQLKGGTALTALLAGGTAGTAIYESFAPNDATLPYVLYQEQSSTWDMLQGTARFVDAVYLVKAVSGSAWPKEADLIDEQIDARLHDAALTVTGYGVVACLRESDVRFSEIAGNQTYWHCGALYRVTLQKT